MIEKFVSEIELKSFQDELINLLEFEKKVNLKKKNKEKLTQEEYFFDTYLIKPSKILGILLQRSNKNERS